MSENVQRELNDIHKMRLTENIGSKLHNHGRRFDCVGGVKMEVGICGKVQAGS